MKLCLTCQACYDDEADLCTTDGHPPLKHGRKGTRIVGRYRLERLLGGGQWGTVYAGTHDGLDRQDAIKLLQMDFILETAKRAHPHLLTDSDAVDRFRKDTIQRFQREAKTAGRLTHQNLVRIYDHGLLSDDEGYISMELIEGQTLQQHIHNLAPVPCPSVISIAQQIAAGLKAAHKNSIIHRDLKPANIMLAWDEGELQVKVLDFGLAKLKEEVLSAGGLTASGTLLGTPYYMSPEQCMGHRDLDHRSDIYSFGVILFEMLAGHRPFEGQSVTSIALKHIREQPPSLRSFRADLPETLIALVHQSLNKSVDERPSSMAEILVKLSEAERTMQPKATGSADGGRRDPIYDPNADTLKGALATASMKVGEGQGPSNLLVRSVVPRRSTTSKVRIYDLAKELKLDTKRLIEEVRREGVDVSVPSNAISKELAEKIRDKYFPTKHARSPRRIVKVVKRAARPTIEDSEVTQPAISATEDFGALLDQFEREQEALIHRPGEDFGALLDQFEREQESLVVGEMVRATVVAITERGVIVDFGYKSEGIVNPDEFMERGKLTVNRGDEVDVVIKALDTVEGFPVLSRADAVRLRTWHDLERAYANGETIVGQVVGRIKGGLHVDILGIAAFLPGSQIDITPVRNLDSMIGQEIKAKVIKLNRKRSNVVLSRKTAIEEDLNTVHGTVGEIEEGLIVEGEIKRLTEYGAFVDLGGIDGLLHVTNMSWAYVQHPADIFKVGDIIQAKILSFDRMRERISLGYKQLLPDPWETVDDRYSVGQPVKGLARRFIEKGLIIEIEYGIEGLVPVTEMTHPWRLEYIAGALKSAGKVADCTITTLDGEARRMTLSMRPAS